MEKPKQMGTHPRRLSNHQKIKLMKLACSLPQDLNGAGWKAHYKEMVELITGTTIQPEETGLNLIETSPIGTTTSPQGQA